MILGAGPAPSLKFVHDCVVAVLVLYGVGIDTGSENALFLGVDNDALAQVVVGGHEHVAVVIDREPVEGAVHRLENEAALALASRRVRGLVGVLGVGVKAAGAALHGVARLNVHAAAARAAGPWTPVGSSGCAGTAGSRAGSCSWNALLLRRRDAGRRTAHGARVAGIAGVDAEHGYLGAFAAVGGGVDDDLCGDGAGGRLLPKFAVGEHLDAVINERREVAVTFEHGHLDDAVVHGPRVAIVGEK